MPAAGVSTSSSRIVVSGSLRCRRSRSPVAPRSRPVAVAVAARDDVGYGGCRRPRSRASVRRRPGSPWPSGFCWFSVLCPLVLALVARFPPSLSPWFCCPGCPGCGPGSPPWARSWRPGVLLPVLPVLVRRWSLRSWVPWSWSPRARAAAPAGVGLRLRASSRPSRRASARASAAALGTAWSGPGRPGRCRSDVPPDWAALMASTSCAFFMEPAPRMPRPPAIDFRSASSMVLSPPDSFFGGAAWEPASEVVGSMVSVT